MGMIKVWIKESQTYKDSCSSCMVFFTAGGVVYYFLIADCEAFDFSETGFLYEGFSFT